MKKTAKTKPGATWVGPNGAAYTIGNVENLRTAADLIGSEFCWDDTEEGMEYWMGVQDNLRRISQNIEGKLTNSGSLL